MQKKLSAILVVILPFVGYFLGFQAGSQSVARQSSDLLVSQQQDSGDRVDLALFWQVWDVVLSKYVDVEQLEPKRMLYGAIKGVVHSLGDPHSEFLDPSESEEFLDGLEGSLTGIGAEVGIRDDMLVVISPLRDSPAERAGLRPGDQIFKINGELSSDYSLFEAVKKIRGAVGTDVVLMIFREGEIEPRKITITRAFIDIESVVSEVRADGIAVVTVATFAEDTAGEFTKALSELALKNLKGLIVDLRYNGGGFLDAAIEMTSKLLAVGDVVLIHERGLSDQVLPVTGTPILPEVPLVVLVNGGSASASEIMAGALQDAGRAKIIGEQSFGKGTVQELINSFPDGSTLRVTVAKWFTPSGRDVTEERITPDIEVSLTNEDYEAERDPQLDRAVEFLLKGQ